MFYYYFYTTKIIQYIVLYKYLYYYFTCFTTYFIKRMSDFHKPDTPITKNINEKRKSLILTLIPNYEKTPFELCKISLICILLLKTKNNLE